MEHDDKKQRERRRIIGASIAIRGRAVAEFFAPEPPSSLAVNEIPSVDFYRTLDDLLWGEEMSLGELSSSGLAIPYKYPQRHPERDGAAELPIETIPAGFVILENSALPPLLRPLEWTVPDGPPKQEERSAVLSIVVRRQYQTERA